MCRSRTGAPVAELQEAPSGGRSDVATAAVWLPPRAPLAQPASATASADGVPGASYIATADNRARVRLFNGPVVADAAPHRAYRGHSSHVASVRFAADDRLLFSAGATDRAVFQWRTCGVNEEDRAADEYVLRAVDEAVAWTRERARANVPQPRNEAGAWARDGATWRQAPDAAAAAESLFRRSLQRTSARETSRLTRSPPARPSAVAAGLVSGAGV